MALLLAATAAARACAEISRVLQLYASGKTTLSIFWRTNRGRPGRAGARAPVLAHTADTAAFTTILHWCKATAYSPPRITFIWTGWGERCQEPGKATIRRQLLKHVRSVGVTELESCVFSTVFSTVPSYVVNGKRPRHDFMFREKASNTSCKTW